MEGRRGVDKKMVLTLSVDSFSSIDQSGSFILTCLTVVQKTLKMLTEIVEVKQCLLLRGIKFYSTYIYVYILCTSIKVVAIACKFVVMNLLVVLGAMGNRSVQGVTNFHLLHFLDHSLQEFIMDTPLHKQTTFRHKINAH